MPIVIPNTATQDGYDPTTTFESGTPIGGGFIQIANNPVFVQMLVGQEAGVSSRTAEVGPIAQTILTITPPTIPHQKLYGVRLRSAVAGSPAQIAGLLNFYNDPGLSAGSLFTATVAPSGSVNLSNVNFVTALPASPTNGQVVFLTDSLVAPTWTLELLWSSGLNKWVSREEYIRFNQQMSTASTVYAQNGFGTTAVWRTRNAAGLKPQVRLITKITNTSAGNSTGTASIQYAGNDADAAEGAAITITASEVISSSLATGVSQLKDSGWADLPGGFSVRDFITFYMQGKSGSGANTMLITYTAFLRWVSI